jgi:uncharacterized protein (TIGR02466 family)
VPIQSLFPTPIYYEELAISDNESADLTDYLLKHFNLSEDPDIFLQSPGNLQNLDLFSNLKKEIEKKSESFWYEIGYKKTNMIVTQMWANLMKGRGFINEHFHSNSLISAIFYLTVPEKNSYTVFTEPSFGTHRMISTKIENDTEYTSDKFQINGRKNLLVLFPSYIYHYSLPSYSDSPRVTISLNLLPAELGDIKSLNYVKIG